MHVSELGFFGVLHSVHVEMIVSVTLYHDVVLEQEVHISAAGLCLGLHLQV